MVGSGVVEWAASPLGAIRLFTDSCALLSLLGSLVGAAVAWKVSSQGRPVIRRFDFAGTARSAALILGAIAFTVQLVILGIRLVYVTVDLVTVFPVESARYYGYGPEGLWSLGYLFVSCAVALASTREQQLCTCQFLIAVMIVVWACLLPPVFRMTSPGSFFTLPPFIG